MNIDKHLEVRLDQGMFENVNIKLGEYLKQARITKCFTQKEVSEILGYSSPQFISNCERGICSPPLNSLKALLKLYEIEGKDVLNLIITEQELYLKNHLIPKKNKRRA